VQGKNVVWYTMKYGRYKRGLERAADLMMERGALVLGQILPMHFFLEMHMRKIEKSNYGAYSKSDLHTTKKRKSKKIRVIKLSELILLM